MGPAGRAAGRAVVVARAVVARAAAPQEEEVAAAVVDRVARADLVGRVDLGESFWGPEWLNWIGARIRVRRRRSRDSSMEDSRAPLWEQECMCSRRVPDRGAHRRFRC